MAPIMGISFLFIQRMIEQLKNTTKASMNRVPPSSWTSIPSIVRWLSIAPLITPNPRKAPNQVNPGTKSKMEAANSVIPDAYLPHGSIPTVSKMYILSGAPVNLKNNVCSMITAAANRNTQLNMLFDFIAVCISLVNPVVVVLHPRYHLSIPISNSGTKLYTFVK